MAAKTVNTENTDELVEIKLPRLKGQYANQEEYYSYNFRNYIIVRGEYVKVPKGLAQMIEDNMRAEEEADRFAIEKAQKEA